MSLQVAELVATLTVDDRKMRPDLDRGRAALRDFGRKAVGAAKLAGIGIAGALVSQIPGAIKSASDLAETGSKVQVLFGDAAAEIQAFAATAATSLGQSKQQALDAASTFAVFGKSAGLAGTDLSKFSVDLVGLSSDMASFFNTDPGQAAEAISAALRGEAEPIRAYGVLLDEATIKAKAIEMGLLKSKVSVEAVAKANLAARMAQKAYNDEVKKSGPNSLDSQKKLLAFKSAQDKLKEATAGTIGDLDKQGKILATVGAISDQTKDAQGDFSRTSDGLANQQRILTAEYENLRAELGQQLLPVAKDLVGVLRAVLGYVKENHTWLIPLVGALTGLGAFIWLVVKAVKAWTVIQAVLNVLLAANPIGLIIIGIAALVAAILWLWNNCAWFRDFWIMVWDGIVSAAKAVGAWFAGPFVDFFKRWFNEAKAIFVAIVSFAIEKFNWWVGFLKSLPGRVAGIFRSIGEGMYGAIRWAINKIIDAWNSLDFGVSISIPEWVPGLGGKGFTIDDVIPDIPRLAKGGLVPGSHKGTPVIMGDGNAVEIASPVPLMRKIVREELGRRGKGLDWAGKLLIEGTGILRGIRKVVRIGGGDPDVVLVGG